MGSTRWVREVVLLAIALAASAAAAGDGRGYLYRVPYGDGKRLRAPRSPALPRAGPLPAANPNPHTGRPVRGHWRIGPARSAISGRLQPCRRAAIGHPMIVSR
jgi:hypothetical protein